MIPYLTATEMAPNNWPPRPTRLAKKVELDELLCSAPVAELWLSISLAAEQGHSRHESVR